MQNNIFIPYKADSAVPPYLPFPRFLIPLDLSNDAKVLYALLFDRAGISKENGFIEADRTVRLYFTVQEAKEKLHRSRQVTTCALIPEMRRLLPDGYGAAFPLLLVR